MTDPVDWRLERDRAIFALEHESQPSVRADAAATLCELAHEPGRADELGPAVARLLADPQDEVRCSGVALAALVLPPAEARPVLVRHLEDRATRVRVEAAGRLADEVEPSDRGALAAALNDASFAVRFEAARGMAALQHASGLEVLIEAVAQDELRFRALGAIAQLGDRSAIPAVRKVFGKWLLPAFERTQAAGVLASLGEADGAAHLLERSRKKSAIDRPMAVELLGEVKAEGAWERFHEILADAKDPVRGAAARGVGRLQDPRGEALLKALLADADEELRLDACEGLLHLGTASARALVEQAVSKLSPAAAAEVRQMLEDTAAATPPTR